MVEFLNRINVNPKVMVGQPVIAGTRLTVASILNLLGQNNSVQDILGAYPGLEKEDIQASLLFASRFLNSVGQLIHPEKA